MGDRASQVWIGILTYWQVGNEADFSRKTMASGTAMAAVAVSSSFTFGMVLTLLGNIKLTLARRLDIGEARVGGLLSALNLALIPMMVISGIWVDASGVRPILSIGCLLTAIGIFGLTLGDNYRSALSALVFMGMGAAGIGTASAVLMPRGFWPDQVVASLNLGSVFFALGALVMPALTDFLLRRFEFRRTMIILSLMCLLPAAVALSLDFTAPVAGGRPEDVFNYQYLWLGGLVFLLYAPLEFAVGTWATTFLTELGVRERRAAWLLSGFWLTFLAGRLVMAFAQHQHYLREGWSAWLLFPLALGVSVVLSNLGGAVNGARAALGLLLLGFLMGPIFPTLLGIVFKQVPENLWGTTYGILFAVGSSSSLIMAPLAGAYARRKSVHETFRLLAPLALVLLCAALLIGLQGGFSR
jgi:fucose permease